MIKPLMDEFKTRDYEIPLFYQYLQVSSGYRAAYSQLNGLAGAVSIVQSKSLLEIADRYGDVWGRDFEAWWFETGINHLRLKYPPEPQIVSRMEGVKSQSDWNDSVKTKIRSTAYKLDLQSEKEFIKEQYYSEGGPPFALVRVPIIGDRTEVLFRLKKLIEEEYENNPIYDQFIQSMDFQVNKIRKVTLEKYLFLIHSRSVKHRTMQEFGKQIAFAFNEDQNIAPETLRIQTTQLMTKAICVAEWAAFGKFPHSSKLSNEEQEQLLQITKDMVGNKNTLNWEFIGEQIACGNIQPITGPS